jgi:hypothetical protein
MNTIYLLLAISCVVMEISSKINTDNIIEKVGLSVIFLGCVISLQGRWNHLIPIGTCVYVASVLLRGLIATHRRRMSDRKET